MAHSALNTTSHTTGMIGYNVNLKSPQRIDEIGHYLDIGNLRGEVASFFNPVGLNFIFITCSDRVADELRKHPAVTTVRLLNRVDPNMPHPKH